MQGSDTQPITETSLSLYFKQRLASYGERFKPPPHEDTCWYLGALLERFGVSEQLFSYEEGRNDLRPLALLYSDALEARNDRERCLLLQQLGDMSLFLGALFPERFQRRGIQMDYIAGMGGSAYDYLADNARQNRHIFAELSATFSRMMEMVANACSRRERLGVDDVVSLYETWLETRDPVVADRLAALGIDLAGADTLH